MKIPIFALLAGLAAFPALGGTYGFPYGIIESGWRSDVRKELPALVNAVDGVSPRNPRYSDPVAPGRHRIQVVFASDRLPSSKAFRWIDLEIEPCTRYRVVAKYQTQVSLGTWEPRVYAEPIGECEARFGGR